MMIKKISASEYVFNKLSKKIRSGEYKPSEKLPAEAELAEKYDVSRNTVRSAISKLATLGLVETFQGKGTFVKEIDFSSRVENLIPQFFQETSNYKSLMDLRVAVESQSAGLAAIRANNEDVQELEKILEDLEAHRDDLNYCSVHDISYHLKIAELSGNELLYSLTKMLRSMLNDVLVEFILYFGNHESMISHRKILNCIKAADSDGAREAMYAHLNTLIKRYSAVIELD